MFVSEMFVQLAMTAWHAPCQHRWLLISTLSQVIFNSLLITNNPQPGSFRQHALFDLCPSSAARTCLVAKQCWGAAEPCPMTVPVFLMYSSDILQTQQAAGISIFLISNQHLPSCCAMCARHGCWSGASYKYIKAIQLLADAIPLCTMFCAPACTPCLLLQRFVDKLRWMSESVYMELFALGQCMPGPTSTQVSFAIGTVKKGSEVSSGTCEPSRAWCKKQDKRWLLVTMSWCLVQKGDQSPSMLQQLISTPKLTHCEHE